MGKRNKNKNKEELDSESSDKTVEKKKKKKYTSKARHFLLTQNNVNLSEKTLDYLKNCKTLRFVIGTREVAPTTKHIHDHFYVQFTNAMAISNKGSQYCHIDKPLGDVFDNIAYIFKLKEPWKRGLVYVKIGEPAYFSGLKVKDVINMTKEDLMELPVQLYPAVKAAMKDFKKPLKASESLKSDLEVFYLWGDSNTLKSKHALECITKKFGDYYEGVHFINNFWNGVKGDVNVALYEDFRDTDMPADEFIKFIDYTIHPLNIKGGTVNNIYTKILITSVQNPTNLYSKAIREETRIQWLRRMKIFNFVYDNEQDKYIHYREDYTYDIKIRTKILQSQFDGIKYNHFDGSMLRTIEENEAIDMKLCSEENFYFKNDDKKDDHMNIDDNKNEDNKPKGVTKVKKKKIEMSKSELKSAVYLAMQKPLDKLPKTNEELLDMLTCDSDDISKDSDNESKGQ